MQDRRFPTLGQSSAFRDTIVMARMPRRYLIGSLVLEINDMKGLLPPLRTNSNASKEATLAAKIFGKCFVKGRSSIPRWLSKSWWTTSSKLPRFGLFLDRCVRCTWMPRHSRQHPSLCWYYVFLSKIHVLIAISEPGNRLGQKLSELFIVMPPCLNFQNPSSWLLRWEWHSRRLGRTRSSLNAILTLPDILLYLVVQHTTSVISAWFPWKLFEQHNTTQEFIVRRQLNDVQKLGIAFGE